MTPSSNQESTNISQRFRSAADWFTSTEQGGIHTFHIGATSERAVDLMHVLSAHFPERAKVAVTSWRDRKSWCSDDCARGDIRDILARLKLLLAGYGGVEISVFNDADQLTLTPELQLIVYSRSDVWRERLLKMGLERRKAPPIAVWCPSRTDLRAAPELTDSLALSVRRLELKAVEFEE
ncbi:MAG: hypothetical protein H7Z40_04825 [Phycisphaerae bacterium]|nr:hypothetical protein [Gemmatimonadaceae bacterium]